MQRKGKTRTGDDNSREDTKDGPTTGRLYLFLNPSMLALLLLDLSSILANSSSQSRTWSNEIGWKMKRLSPSQRARVHVFADEWESRNRGRVEAVFLGSGQGERKRRSIVLSLSSISEGNWRFDASLGPADVWGRRGGLVLGRPTGGGEDLEGLWIVCAGAPN